MNLTSLGFGEAKKFSFSSVSLKYCIIKFIAELEMQNFFLLPSPTFSTNLKEFFLHCFHERNAVSSIFSIALVTLP